jgi:hypothetical protein
VNVSSFVRYVLRAEHKQAGSLLVPLLGFVICLYLWLSLGTTAKWAGFIWLTIGLLYGAWRTSWFRKPMDFARITSDEDTASTVTTPEPLNR